MKASSVRCAQLGRLLLDLQFTETRADDYHRFKHPQSGTVFVFRPYAPNDLVSMQDVTSTRTHLDWRGLLSGIAFDDSLTKTPA